jgi:hypothetical protein
VVALARWKETAAIRRSGHLNDLQRKRPVVSGTVAVIGKRSQGWVRPGDGTLVMTASEEKVMTWWKGVTSIRK